MLLCSGQEPGLRHVAGCLLYYGQLCKNEISLGSVRESLSSHATTEPLTLNITNKYYTAAIELWLHNPTSGVKRAPGSRSASTEGCIAVLPVDSAIDSLTTELAELAVAEDISVRLAVAVKDAPGAGSVDEWRSQRVEWCLDHGFEYVEIDFSNVTEGWESREKDGLPRVIEALEMNMWSSMERRAPDMAEKKPPAETEVASSSYTPPDLVEAPPNLTAKEVAETPQAIKREASLKKPSDAEEVASLLPTDQDDGEDDKVWNVFSSFIEEARSIRGQAQTNGISDAERRKRAADMATRFAEMMLPPGELDSSDDELP